MTGWRRPCDGAGHVGIGDGVETQFDQIGIDRAITRAT